MPMCRSSQISDAQLRASRLPANDNLLPVTSGIRPSHGSRSTLKASWQAVLFLCVTALLIL
jgi:hypothetical protein